MLSPSRFRWLTSLTRQHSHPRGPSPLASARWCPLKLCADHGFIVPQPFTTQPPWLRLAPCYQDPHARAGLGSAGGSRKAGGPVRSSALSGEAAAASLAVSGGRFHFSSTSLSTEVWSSTSPQT